MIEKAYPKIKYHARTFVANLILAHFAAEATGKRAASGAESEESPQKKAWLHSSPSQS